MGLELLLESGVVNFLTLESESHKNTRTPHHWRRHTSTAWHRGSLVYNGLLHEQACVYFRQKCTNKHRHKHSYRKLD